MFSLGSSGWRLIARDSVSPGPYLENRSLPESRLSHLGVTMLRLTHRSSKLVVTGTPLPVPVKITTARTTPWLLPQDSWVHPLPLPQAFQSEVFNNVLQAIANLKTREGSQVSLCKCHFLMACRPR